MSKALVMAGWDDAPHLSAEEKEELLRSTPPHQRKARSQGIPQLGSGAIYPVEESDILVDPFPLPEYWPRAYGFDVGWRRTAAVWAAHDRASGVWYLYSEHYRGQAEPSVHAHAVRQRGDWIPGAIDPAARGRSQDDGRNLLDTYSELGLDLTKADNAVEAGLHQVLDLLSTSRLKVFTTLQNWLSEYRIYRRDEQGKIIKENDHLMDATRYFVMTARDLARTKIEARIPTQQRVTPDAAGY